MSDTILPRVDFEVLAAKVALEAVGEMDNDAGFFADGALWAYDLLAQQSKDCNHGPGVGAAIHGCETLVEAGRHMGGKPAEQAKSDTPKITRPLVREIGRIVARCCKSFFAAGGADNMSDHDLESGFEIYGREIIDALQRAGFEADAS